ncbi:MAG: DUF3788 domain-containing protein [Rikenellaceae bacterium]|jgi:hypothetical protein|nr:DUF3788 domain-containing protein [Rikenellaceae bacterium]
MEELLLREAALIPDDGVLAETLGGTYGTFRQLMERLAASGLTADWNFYKDGKAWLCKISNKKSTVAWGGVFGQGFRLTFYFTEKTLPGVLELEIDPEEGLRCEKPVGKLIPVTVYADRDEKLDAIEKVIVYKKSLK